MGSNYLNIKLIFFPLNVQCFSISSSCSRLRASRFREALGVSDWPLSSANGIWVLMLCTSPSLPGVSACPFFCFTQISMLLLCTALWLFFDQLWPKLLSDTSEAFGLDLNKLQHVVSFSIDCSPQWLLCTPVTARGSTVSVGWIINWNVQNSHFMD